MDKRFTKLFEPIMIGNIKLKNRIYMPSMCTNFAGPSGESTIVDLGWYAARARGGAGLITIDYSLISPEGKGTLGQRGLWKDEFMPYFSRIVDTIKSSGARVSTQLHHGGANAVVKEPVGPSPLGNCEFFTTQPRELSTEEVEQMVEKYADAAIRAKNCGVDMVEIHGASGYLICQFLSPLFNMRTDKYGRDRILFAEEIVQRIKQKCGADFPLSFRMDADQFYPGGITLDYSKIVAKRLEDAGVDLLNIIGGTPDTEDYTEPNMYIEDEEEDTRYRFIKLASEIKKTVNIPVVSGGLLTNPFTAEQILEEGVLDMVFLGRQLIADPDWPNKVRNGRLDDIRPCCRCNDGCVGRVFLGKSVWCTVNPLSGNEYRWSSEEALPKPAIKKKVLVVGAGFAGMEAARISAIRGHQVTIIDKADKVGGVINLIKPMSFKKHWIELVDWYSRQINKLGVNIQLNTMVTVDSIKENSPDVVILATGSEPFIPSIPGIEKALVLDDVLKGTVEIGQKVIIMGGGQTGLDLALYLAKKCKEITILEALPEVCINMETTTMLSFFRKHSGLIDKYNIKLMVSSSVVEVKNNGVEIIDKIGRRTLIEGDTIICALGRKSVLDNGLRDVTEDVFTIGDANKVRNITEAIHEGFMTALNI